MFLMYFVYLIFIFSILTYASVLEQELEEAKTPLWCPSLAKFSSMRIVIILELQLS